MPGIGHGTYLTDQWLSKQSVGYRNGKFGFDSRSDRNKNFEN